MNCTGCGAAMELVATRGYYFCRYCGAFHFPETTAGEGVRVLGAAQPPLACPACRKALSSAIVDELFPVHHCANCRGLLVPRGKFVDIVHKRRAWATNPPSAPVPIDADELQRQVRCPVCTSAMETHPYYGPGNVVIDNCQTCDIVWLDFGELRQIVDAPGRDRGTRDIRPYDESRVIGTAAEEAEPERPAAPGVVAGIIELLNLLS
jgi:Zn-finger nucleic acid-binding protein